MNDPNQYMTELSARKAVALQWDNRLKIKKNELNWLYEYNISI